MTGDEAAEIDAEHDVELNIILEPDTTASAVVSGTVRSSEGGPVVGQRIHLSSGKGHQNYRADTDKDGKFVMQGVELSDDYMLSINAADAYEDYFQRKLQVTKDGLTLAIELKAKDVGTLSGQMVDRYGNPIPNFSLVLQRKQTSAVPPDVPPPRTNRAISGSPSWARVRSFSVVELSDITGPVLIHRK